MNAVWATRRARTGIGVVRLEHDHLVEGHVAEVVPAVCRVVDVARRVVEDQAAELLGDGLHRDLVGRCERAGVAHREGEVLRRRRGGAPDVVEGPARGALQVDVGHERSHHLGQLHRGCIGVVGVGIPRGLGVHERRELLRLALAVALLASAEHHHVRCARRARDELGDLVDVLLVDGRVLLDQVEVLHRAHVRHEHEPLPVEVGVEPAGVGDPDLPPRKRGHGRAALVLGDEFEHHVVAGCRRVPDVVDLGVDTHARAPRRRHPSPPRVTQPTLQLWHGM